MRTAVVVGIAAVAALGTPARAAEPEQPRPCADAEVVRLVVAFIDSFNAGERRRLDRMFAREPDFRSYSTHAPGERILPASSHRPSLSGYFRRRHELREHLRLERLHVTGNVVGRRPYGNFTYALTRSARDLAATAYAGKGALYCYERRPDVIFVWSMAPR